MSYCTYCGLINGDHRDHVIPVSFTHTQRIYEGTVCVPACRECNTSLSNLMYVTIESRAGYLLGKYRQKYKKILLMPNWTEEELEEMSSTFQATIRANLASRLVVQQRLTNLEAVSLGQEVTFDHLTSVMETSP